MFDPRLLAKVTKVVDVSYGGENGLNQAIELSQEAMVNLKYVQEKNLISKFFSDIAMDTGKVVYGLQETMAVIIIINMYIAIGSRHFRTADLF